jgi:hypothetical protein
VKHYTAFPVRWVREIQQLKEFEMEHLEEILIPLASFWLIFMIIKTSLDYKTRKSLIDKGMVNEKVRFLSKYENGFMGSLKWGLVLLGIGVGLLIYKIVPASTFVYRGDEEVFAFGMMSLCAGVGLVIYYFIASSMSKKKPESGQEREI